MNRTRGPRARLVYAAAMVVIFSWAWISPLQASAQLLPIQLPPLLGGLVVTITSPPADSTVDGTITVSASVSPLGVCFTLLICRRNPCVSCRCK